MGEASRPGVRDTLRRSFDDDAARYHRALPRYPEAVFAAIDALAPGRRLVEIGAGTGIATRPLVARGYEVTALEPGPSLAAIARGSGAEVVVTDAEGWAPAEPADVVVCFTAFHWLDPATRLGLVASWLRPGGLLALVDGRHVAGPADDPSNAFFAASQACYERWDPTTPPGLRLANPSELPIATEFDGSPLFTGAGLQRFPARYHYTTEEYLDLLLTFSGHRVLPDDDRAGLLACLRRLLDDGFGGRIEKSQVFELRSAVRASGGA